MSIRVQDGRAIITCSHDTADVYGRRGNNEGCGRPAVMLILVEEEIWHAGDSQENLTVAEGYCEEHAPEEAHEARSSMSSDEFVIVEVTA